MWRKPEDPKFAAAPPMFPASNSPEDTSLRTEPLSAASNSTVPSVAAPAPSAGGLLTSTLVIKGEISGSEDLMVDGEVHGKIQINEGKVTIGPHGRVSADIVAREILVRGKVEGSLRGRERVEIASTGEVRGDVFARRLVIEEGAAIKGSIEIERPAEMAPPRAARVSGDGAELPGERESA